MHRGSPSDSLFAFVFSDTRGVPQLLCLSFITLKNHELADTQLSLQITTVIKLCHLQFMMFVSCPVSFFPLLFIHFITTGKKADGVLRLQASA